MGKFRQLHVWRSAQLMRLFGATALLVVASVMLLSGQKLAYEYFAIREGISSRLVTDLVYDQNGLVWVGTSNGLNRFDGYEFVNFYSGEDPRQPYRLSQNHIAELNVAPNGELILFYEDLYTSFDLFDPVSYEVKKVEVSLEIKGQVRALFVDWMGDIYAIGKGIDFTSLSRYNYQLDVFEELFVVEEFWRTQYPEINALHLFNDEFMLYDQEHGLRLFDADGRLVKYFPPDENGLHTNNDNLPSNLSIFHQASDGRVWLSYYNLPGLFTWTSLQAGFMQDTRFDPEEIYGYLWEDAQDNLLINETENQGNFPVSSRAILVRPEGNVLDYSNILETSDYIIAVCSQDFLRSIFLGTDTGLKIVQNPFSRVEQYLSQNIGEDRRGYSMRGITGDGEGNVYFAREVEHWYHLDLATNILDTITLYDEASGRPIDFTCGLGLFYDPAGYLWGVSCDGTPGSDGILYRYHIQSCFTERFIYPHRFSAMEIAEDGTIWLGATGQNGVRELVAFDRSAETFTEFRDKDGVNTFAETIIRYIVEDKEQHIWVGTEAGAYYVDPIGGEVEVFQKLSATTSGESGQLPDNVVFAIHLDDLGKVWFGTQEGLASYDPAQEEWRVYTTKDGLAGNTVAGILPDEEGGLWVSTYNGLSYFSPNEGLLRKFYRMDGISHNEFNRFSFYQDQNGRYYFGGVNGVNAFYSDDLLVKEEIPKVLLAAFSRYDGSLDSLVNESANLIGVEEIIVEPHYEYFSLSFALPIYTPNLNNQFRYRFDNDEEWIYLKEGRSLRYNDIKAGNYGLYVQGADPNGNWGSESLVLRMIVREVFYKSWWFIALMILAVIGAAYGVLRYRMMERLRIERLRTRLASDLHDEVSGLLAGISLQSELLKDQVEDDDMREKLQRIRVASQGAMSKMSDVIWSIDSRRDRISDLIIRMEEHADEVLLPINVRYHIQVDQLDPSQKLPANIRQDLYFIYKEAINNVAKHAHASEVNVRIGNSGPQFELVVKDDGNGEQSYSKNGRRKRKGQGLANLQMRAQRLNAQLEIRNGQGYTIHLRMKKFA